MRTIVRFRSVELPVLPPNLESLVVDIELRLPDMAATVGPSGGLKRDDLLRTIAPVARAYGLGVPEQRTFAGSEIDLLSTSARAAVSVQAGRAKTNNGGLLAVLAAAAMPTVDWLILIVPERYKGSTTAPPVRHDVHALARSGGIELDLSGVVILSY